MWAAPSHSAWARAVADPVAVACHQFHPVGAAVALAAGTDALPLLATAQMVSEHASQGRAIHGSPVQCRRVGFYRAAGLPGALPLVPQCERECRLQHSGKWKRRKSKEVGNRKEIVRASSPTGHYSLKRICTPVVRGRTESFFDPATKALQVLLCHTLAFVLGYQRAPSATRYLNSQ
eukprot:scaffold952_cov409-Prasinococcus_capsulatus_cf.AAC.28